MTAQRLRHPRATLALLAFAQLVIALDYNIVFVALPKISEGLAFTESALQWVVSGYAVVFGGFLMLGGRLSDLFGRRRMFVTGMVLYAAASLAGGLATEPWLLIVARAGQGLGGALLAPATLSLVTTIFEEGRTRNRAMGLWAAAGSTGMVLGSLLGGVLAGALGWGSVFFVNVPLGIIGAGAAFVFLPSDQPATARTRLDIPGAVTSTVGILAIVYGMVQAPQIGWGAAGTLLPLLAGIILLVVFVMIERKVASPLVPVALFSNAGLRTGTATTFVFMASFGALPFFITIYLQQIANMDPLTTGLIFMLPSACVLLGTMIGGRLSNIWSSRRILALAWGVGTVGTILTGIVMATRGPVPLGALPFAALSLAQGVVFTVMYSVATAGIPAADQGVSSGIATSGQQIGGAVGLAVLVAAATAAGSTRLGTLNLDFTTAGMAGIVVLLLLGLLIATTVRSPAQAEVEAPLEDRKATTVS